MTNRHATVASVEGQIRDRIYPSRIVRPVDAPGDKNGNHRVSRLALQIDAPFDSHKHLMLGRHNWTGVRFDT